MGNNFGEKEIFFKSLGLDFAYCHPLRMCKISGRSSSRASQIFLKIAVGPNESVKYKYRRKIYNGDGDETPLHL